MTFIDFLYKLDGWVWGTPLIVLIMVVGIYYMVKGKFFPFVHFGHAVKNTVLASSTESGKSGDGKISPYRAFCLALGGAVGMGNISGVATSIAVGGPGSIFWMWVWAFFGMMIKTAETSLGLYYRHKEPDGKYSGSAMHYMEWGIKGEMGWKFGRPLAILFAVSLFMMVLQGSGAYTVGETLSASFGLNLMAVVIVYVLFVVYLLIRGENAIGRVAEKLVPIMCGAYLLATIVILLMNITYVPTMFAEIFKGAFTGTAAVGGFAGSVVSLTIRQGVARSVYSNEAGNGTSPLIHGSADTIHPVRQGLWGAVEVFCDTLVVCTCSGSGPVLPGHHDRPVRFHHLHHLVSFLSEYPDLPSGKMAQGAEGRAQGVHSRFPADHGRECRSGILFQLRRHAVLDHRQHRHGLPPVLQCSGTDRAAEEVLGTAQGL